MWSDLQFERDRWVPLNAAYVCMRGLDEGEGVVRRKRTIAPPATEII